MSTRGRGGVEGQLAHTATGVEKQKSVWTCKRRQGASEQEAWLSYFIFLYDLLSVQCRHSLQCPDLVISEAFS